MKRLLIFALLCALLLSGCVTNRPEDHMLDGDGMEKTEPDPIPTDVQIEPEPVPTDEQIEAMRPKLILDGCEPGTANGRRVRITDYQDGKLTAELSNDSGELWMYVETFSLSVRDGDSWHVLPWPEDKVWEDSEFDLPDGETAKVVFDVTALGPLDSGEYLLKTNGLETTFWLVYTE